MKAERSADENNQTSLSFPEFPDKCVTFPPELNYLFTYFREVIFKSPINSVSVPFLPK